MLKHYCMSINQHGDNYRMLKWWRRQKRAAWSKTRFFYIHLDLSFTNNILLPILIQRGNCIIWHQSFQDKIDIYGIYEKPSKISRKKSFLLKKNWCHKKRGRLLEKALYCPLYQTPREYWCQRNHSRERHHSTWIRKRIRKKQNFIPTSMFFQYSRAWVYTTFVTCLLKHVRWQLFSVQSLENNI